MFPGRYSPGQYSPGVQGRVWRAQVSTGEICQPGPGLDCTTNTVRLTITEMISISTAPVTSQLRLASHLASSVESNYYNKVPFLAWRQGCCCLPDSAGCVGQCGQESHHRPVISHLSDHYNKHHQALS